MLSPLLHTIGILGTLSAAKLKNMRTGKKEEDYFIPPLAPYVQWVKAYNKLISSIYDENKTVGRAWKAFRKAVPGIERRLEFGVFEQILLFSLFLFEWNKSEKTTPSREKDAQHGSSAAYAFSKEPGDRLEQVIQKLRETIDERDRALWNIQNYEQDAIALKERKERLEKQAADFDKALQILRNDLDGANEQLNRVRQELDASRAEIVSLREQNVALTGEKVSLQQQIEELPKKQDPVASVARRAVGVELPASRIAAAEERPDRRKGPAQSVIQWQRQTAPKEIIPKPARPAPVKIGRWNAQLSKDGYYRLFRKIRGKVHSIYIGKELDVEKAEMKIADKERALLGQGAAPWPGGDV